MTQISNNYIQNVDNYNSKFQDTPSTIFIKYSTIINEYLKHCFDNIYIQNPIYYTYIIKRGLDTLTHIFNILLLYTKNLDMIYYNCQKAYIYYIEFIGQIGDDNHGFLQLNSKDASLFVYKKTIFEINNDIRKDFICDEEATKIMADVNIFIKIHNIILYKLIDTNTIIDVIKYINTDLQNILQKIIKIFIEQNNGNKINKTNKINSILIFSTHFKRDNILDYLDIFIKKLRKKDNIDLRKLEQYILDTELYNNLSHVKYINNLMNHI